jgi:hypothetical protein
LICWRAISANQLLPGSDEDRCYNEESDSIPRCSIPNYHLSYNLRRILIALGAVIAEMPFPGQIGIRGFGFTSFATCLHTVLVALETLFPDPADRFLDVGDADGGNLGLGRALSPAVELETRLQFARDEAG